VPDAVANLVERMISIEREKRPQDLREVMEILRLFSDVTVQSFGTARFVAPEKEKIDPYSETTFAPKGKRRWPLLAAVGALCLLAGGGVMYKLRSPEVAPRNAVVTPPPAAAVPPPVAAATPPVAAAVPPVAVQPVAAEAPKPADKHHAAKKLPAAHPQKADDGKKKLPGGVVDEVPF
jgi:hypothetical protein